MPLIHFAFGGHHRAGEHEEQLRAFTEHILLPKRLRSFACPEFLPILNSPTAKWGKPSSAVTLDDGSVTFTEWIPSPPVGLLPNDVFMISFVNTSLRKLRNWKPAEHYGKLGIAFTDDFKRRNGILLSIPQSRARSPSYRF